jgi:hypothetical protein
MFNVPAAVVATVVVLVGVHAVRMLVLTDEEDLQFLLTFAFIPARYDIDLVIGGSFPGGFGADLWTFFTYAFLHADLLHIGLNLAWLLPFGTALARRFGTWRYAAFMLVVAAAGAFAHLITHPGAIVPMIGASAAISGAMAAALRFVFQPGGPLGLWRGEADGNAYRVPAAPLLATLRDPAFPRFPGRLARIKRAVRPRFCSHRRARPGDCVAGSYRRLPRRLFSVQGLRSGRPAGRIRR